MGTALPPKSPHPIVVIADDLSGAAELAGIANLRGLSSEVQRAFDPDCDADLIAIDTDSRRLPQEEAARRVDSVARIVISARPAWIYKKVDAVLRGNVRAEIEAILRVMATSLAVLAPANPSRGRTIKGGQLLIDGLPLHESLFRQDPEQPRNTSNVAELLGPSDRIYVPDVGDMSIVTQLAQRLLPTTLPA